MLTNLVKKLHVVGNLNSHISYLTSSETESVYLRDLESGIYILNGNFKYNDSTMRLVLDIDTLVFITNDLGDITATIVDTNSMPHIIRMVNFMEGSESPSYMDIWLEDLAYVGQANQLDTENKTDLVSAINELVASSGKLKHINSDESNRVRLYDLEPGAYILEGTFFIDETTEKIYEFKPPAFVTVTHAPYVTVTGTEKDVYVIALVNNSIEIFKITLGGGTTINSIPIETFGTINEKLDNAVVPVGGIIMWSGSVVNIPVGWALCDGTKGTPDLRNRFVVGAGDEYLVGDVGGEKEHTLTVEELPEITGRYSLTLNKSDMYSPHGVFETSDITEGYYQYQDAYEGTSINSISELNFNNGGKNMAHENRPPYYALAYIMRT